MLKKGIIVRITFSDTKTTLLQKQQLYMIQSLSYKKLSGSKQQLDFQIFTKFLKNMVNFKQGGLLDVVTE